MDTQNNLEHGDMNKKKEECLMCKFVLIFAFTVLLLVLAFTFYYRLPPPPPLEPLSPELSPPVDPMEYRQQLLDVGRILHPELSTSSFPEVHTNPSANSKLAPTYE